MQQSCTARICFMLALCGQWQLLTCYPSLSNASEYLESSLVRRDDPPGKASSLLGQTPDPSLQRAHDCICFMWPLFNVPINVVMSFLIILS